jgi:ATP-dependent Lhr-like helicase
VSALHALHPAIRTWFERRFSLGPTEPQAGGWPEIAAGRDTLIAAPTGSGKTLSAFLTCIDRLYRDAERGALPSSTDVVYVSPLKALAVDVRENLVKPLQEIRKVAYELGHAAPEIRVETRSGDTPASRRAAMLKKPPHILVTTPESLYLMLTAERSRETLRRTRTVIVDEIHAVARDKRGSHLALSLERLEALCDSRPVRVGLSATQRPIDTIARLLVGSGPDATKSDGTPQCSIVDVGHRRALDLAIEVPGSELGAVISMEQWDEVLTRIAGLVNEHRTTLIFTNTRRMAERIAHMLAERLGEDDVAAHHGSLSKDRRLKVEERLRAGDLRALVATASLELGIDVGPVELVCQLGSPRSIATFLQRVGRSGHSRGATPKGRLFPTTRDELVECAALVRAVNAGRLDAVRPPVAPLDILAQQIVAACSAEEWKESELFERFRRASPYAELSREVFGEIVELLSEGIQTGRGRRAAYLHRDRVGGMLRGRRGARLAALTSGGAIPDTADYRVVADPDDTYIGSVNEDWAIESMAGDIFLLGSTSWRIRRVESGVVRVRDAEGAPPTIPFWLGEAPARTEELSAEVSNLRSDVEAAIEGGGLPGFRNRLREEAALDPAGVDQLLHYLVTSRESLGALPTRERVVVERFFDETGGMQLVVHAPFGGRINRALGLAVRKRICKSFDFELQAAANDDAIVLSLGPQHSFPLESFPSMLGAGAIRQTLEQAVLATPFFTVRWRWNLGRALAVLRFRGGRKNPPPIQRMEADDLMAAVFPGLAQCQENQAGPIELPDHPIVRQTMNDCLSEALDAEGLSTLLRGIHEGDVEVHSRETTEPSPLCHEILNGRPYTFLDDAPLEERRTRAVALRRGLPVAARDLAALDADAVARVRDEARPTPRDVDELHDLLLGLVVLQPEPGWQAWFDALRASGRAVQLSVESGVLWCSIERLAWAQQLFPGCEVRPARVPGSDFSAAPEEDEVLAELLRGQLDVLGPVTVAELCAAIGLTSPAVERGLARLEAEGFALVGHFDPTRGSTPPEEWCARRLLARIHGYTKARLRREIEPVSAQDYMRFLLAWHRVLPDRRREGRRGVEAAIEQLQGFELAAGAWERPLLEARVAHYRAEWLDALCLSGQISWGRLSLGTPSAREATPSRVTPITLAIREDWPWLLAAARGSAVPEAPTRGPGAQVLRQLEQRGALFQSELATQLDGEQESVRTGLWDLVTRGLVSSDGFESLRRLLDDRVRRTRSVGARRRLRRPAAAPAGVEGRWARVQPPLESDSDVLAEAVAEQLLQRWGVLFYDLLARESLALSWREILLALRRLEARGEVRGGRFVTGFSGEQFALPEAVAALRETRRRPRDGQRVTLSAVDPLNLVGIVTPGVRVPAIPTRQVVYEDGLPVEPAAAVPESPSAGKGPSPDLPM